MLSNPLERLIPKADALLATPIESLVPILLKLAKEQYQSAGFIPSAVSDIGVSEGYPGYKKNEVEKHLSRAWNLIERKGLIEPSPDINGRNGWRMFTDEGEAIANGADIETIRVIQAFPKALLHKAVIEKCWGLLESGHYPEAVEKSFKVVRDRLRDLTGHETGSEAFGKSNLHIGGAMAPNVDKDFNEGAKFLTMAIDKFRNEKSHTSERGVDDPNKAFQYLVMSSLAMRLLDGAKIK